jgi:hypothetical protein
VLAQYSISVYRVRKRTYLAMKAGVALLCLLAGASATEVTPVQKVVALMEGMLEKGQLVGYQWKSCRSFSHVFPYHLLAVFLLTISYHILVFV